MKRSRSLGLACCLLALPLLVFGQSLGEAGRKERTRRQDSSRAARRTVTGEDLAANEGRLANDPGEAEAVEIEQSPEAAPLAPGQIVSVDAPPPTRGRGERFWRAWVSRARQRVELAKLRYNELLRQIRFGQPVQFATRTADESSTRS